jgi:hypothetical protein
MHVVRTLRDSSERYIKSRAETPPHRVAEAEDHYICGGEALFTNREIGIIFWLVVLFIFIIIKRNRRESLIDVLKVLTSRIFLIIIACMLLYIGGILYLLYKIEYWELYLIKDTLIWIIFNAFVLMLSSNDKALKEGFFKQKLIESIKIIVVIQFIANTYTFNLFIEVVLVFVLVFLGALQAVAGTNEKYKPVEKLTSGLISILGLVILSNAIYLAIKDFNSLGSLVTLKSFLLPIILTGLYLPYVYCLALFSVYERIFGRLKTKTYIDKKLRRTIMRRILFKFHFRLQSLRKFQTKDFFKLVNVRSKEDVKQFFDNFNTNEA